MMLIAVYDAYRAPRLVRQSGDRPRSTDLCVVLTYRGQRQTRVLCGAAYGADQVASRRGTGGNPGGEQDARRHEMPARAARSVRGAARHDVLGLSLGSASSTGRPERKSRLYVDGPPPVLGAAWMAGSISSIE